MQQSKQLSLKHNYLPARGAENKKAPILFLVHGYGADQNDLFSLSGEFPEDFHIVAPQAPYPLMWGGYAWYSLNFDDSDKKFADEEQMVASREKLAFFIREATEAYRADENDVWLLGFSQGAILSYGIMSAYPDLVRRYMPLSGYIDPGVVVPYNGMASYQGVKAIAMHGSEDTVIPVSWGRAVQGFMAERGIDYRYREYPIGHGICPEGLAELRAWITENR